MESSSWLERLPLDMQSMQRLRTCGVDNCPYLAHCLQQRDASYAQEPFGAHTPVGVKAEVAYCVCQTNELHSLQLFQLPKVRVYFLVPVVTAAKRSFPPVQ